MLISFSQRGVDAKSLSRAFDLDPNTVTRFDLPFGELLAFFPVFESDFTECSLLLKVSPERLPKDAPYLGSGHPLRAYVHERAYATSSLMAVALQKGFPALENVVAHPDSAPIRIRMNTVTCNLGPSVVEGWFSELGYQVSISESHPTLQDGQRAQFIDLELTTGLSLPSVIGHLQTLLCAMDQDHVHWIGKDATVSIFNAAAPWLENHSAHAAIKSALLGVPYTAGRNARQNLVEENETFSFPTKKAFYRNPMEAQQVHQEIRELIPLQSNTSVLHLFPESGQLAAGLCQNAHIYKVSLVDIVPEHLQVIVQELNGLALSAESKRKVQLLVGAPIFHGELESGFDVHVIEGILGKLPSHQLAAVASTVFHHGAPKCMIVVEPMGKELKNWAAEIVKEYPFDVEFKIPKVTDAPKAVPMALAIFTARSTK